MNKRRDVNFIEVALPVPLRKVFDYRIDTLPLDPVGCRVQVPFGKRQLVGVILGTKTQTDLPAEQLKTVTAVIDHHPLLPKRLIQLCQFASQYYHHPIGEVLFTGLPKTLRLGKNYAWPTSATTWIPAASHLILNTEQEYIVSTLEKNSSQFSRTLIDGVTGSGKTQVYLAYLQHLLQKPGQILILIPEISLSPQTTHRFQQLFGDAVWFYHSQIGEKQRREVWLKARAGVPGIYIGTRSSLFLPFTELKSIIVDEEHDTSFKQQEGFKYHARDLAIKLAQLFDIPILLGSATPSLVTLHHAAQNHYQWLKLTARANQKPLPPITLVAGLKASKGEFLAKSLLLTIEKHLKEQHQVLLFINRRGYAPVLICNQCDYIAHCKRCDVKLVYHQLDKRLHCHHCQKTEALPTTCPDCHHSSMHLLGAGTERIEAVLAEHFVDYPILRIDSDNTRKKGELQKYLDQIALGTPCLILGTQMLAKGHDFPFVTLAVILDLDAGLFSTDFNAAEQCGQLLIQVAGRAGRGNHVGEVVCQTNHPENPLLQDLLQTDYKHFTQTLLQQRKQAGLPPYSYVALFRSQAPQALNAQQLLQNLYQQFHAHLKDTCWFLGPSPAPITRRHGQYHYQLLLLSSNRQDLHIQVATMVDQLKIQKTQRARWSVEMDPVDLS
jgi:primosomal protein N' (replication factor Y)